MSQSMSQSPTGDYDRAERAEGDYDRAGIMSQSPTGDYDRAEGYHVAVPYGRLRQSGKSGGRLR